MAFRIAPEQWDETIDYLQGARARNQRLSRTLPAVAAGGRQGKQAIAYVVDRSHTQYAGGLDAIAAARVVHGAQGQSGPNDAYVFNTLAHLQDMGIRDHWLEQVVGEVERLRKAA